MGLIGWPELILILVIVIFIFGASRITELAKAIGVGVKEYKKATEGEPQMSSKDAAVKEAAEKMGIDTEDKSTSQLLDEMGQKK